MAYQIVEFNGHFARGADWKNPKFWWQSEEKRLEEIMGDLKWRPNIQEKLLAGEVVRHTPRRQLTCRHCGAQLTVEIRGEELRVVGEPCEFPDGIEFWEEELNVPSGKIVIRDDLRQYFEFKMDLPDDGKGWVAFAKAWAARGMIYGQVGNTCPTVHKTGKTNTSFRIVNQDEDTYDEERGEWVEIPAEERAFRGRRVAAVCTDLWAYHCVDYREFERRVEEGTLREALATVKTFSVKKGVYRFRHYIRPREVEKGGTLFAEIEWVRPPDPEINFYWQEQSERLPTALEGCLQAIEEYPTLYLPRMPADESRTWDEQYDRRVPFEACSEEQRERALARAADHFMCVLGGGVEWGKRGVPVLHISPRVRQLAIDCESLYGTALGAVPTFTRRQHWYPLCDRYGGLAHVASTDGVERTWVLLAQNVCQSYLSFPRPADDNTYTYPRMKRIREERQRLRLVRDRYLQIRERYPSQVLSAQVDEDIRNGALGDEYVNTYDYGPPHAPKEQWGQPPKVWLVPLGAKFSFDARTIAKPAGLVKDGRWAGPADATHYALSVLREDAEPHLEEGSDPACLALESWECSARNAVPVCCEGITVRHAQAYGGPLLVVEIDGKTYGIKEEDLPALTIL
jgi:hypothetical protein